LNSALLLLVFLLFNNSGFSQINSTELKYSTFEECFNKQFKKKPKIIPQTNLQLNIKETYLLGSEYFKNKSYSTAIPYLWNVFLTDSVKFAKNAIRKIADAYFNLQKQDSTLYACYVGIKRFPTIPRLHYYAAYIHENNKNYECALYHYEVMVNLNPDDYNYLKKLKVVYEKNKQVNGKEYSDLKNRIEKYFDDKYLEIIKKSFFQPDIVYKKLFEFQDRSLCGHDLNNQHKLTDYYTLYLDSCNNLYIKDTLNLQNAYLYSKALFYKGAYTEAIKILSRLKEIDNDKTKILRIRAKYFLYNNNLKESLVDFRKILQYDPDDYNVMSEISNIYRMQNNFSMAMDWIEKAKESNLSIGLYYIKKAEILESLVSFCQKGRSRIYDDGLIYQLAYNFYDKALGDNNYKNEAQKRLRNLRPFLLTDEEKKENNFRNDILLDCYKF